MLPFARTEEVAAAKDARRAVVAAEAKDEGDACAVAVGVESCCHCCADAAVTDADAVDAAKVKIRH